MVRRSSALVSEPTDGLELRSLSDALRGAVDVEESEERLGAWMMVGELQLAFMSVEASAWGRVFGTTSLIVGERGSISCFSCIELIIFSRSSGRKRLSLPLLEDNDGDFNEDAIVAVASEEESGDEASVDASDAMVEVLVERSGTSFREGLDVAALTVEVAIDLDDCGLLHSVCRLIVLHIMFSSLLPSSRQSAWLLLEKTVSWH